MNQTHKMGAPKRFNHHVLPIIRMVIEVGHGHKYSVTTWY